MSEKYELVICTNEEFQKIHKVEVVKEYESNGLTLLKEGVFSKETSDELINRMNDYTWFEKRDIYYEDFNEDGEDDFKYEPIPIGYGNPINETWLDIEGIGYGWVAITGDEEENKKILSEVIKNDSIALIDDGFNYVLLEYKDSLIYHIFSAKEFNDYDELFILSKREDSELFYI